MNPVARFCRRSGARRWVLLGWILCTYLGGLALAGSTDSIDQRINDYWKRVRGPAVVDLSWRGEVTVSEHGAHPSTALVQYLVKRPDQAKAIITSQFSAKDTPGFFQGRPGSALAWNGAEFLAYDANTGTLGRWNLLEQRKPRPLKPGAYLIPDLGSQLSAFLGGAVNAKAERARRTIERRRYNKRSAYRVTLEANADGEQMSYPHNWARIVRYLDAESLCPLHEEWVDAEGQTVVATEFLEHREVAPGLVVPLLCRTRVAEAVRPGSEMKWYGHKRVRFEDDGTETIEELKPAFREVEGLGGVPAHTTTRRYRWVGGQLLVVSEILVQDDKGSLLFAARFHHFRLNTGLRDEGFTAWTAGQGGRVQ